MSEEPRQPNPELELFTVDQLIAELKARSEDFVVAARWSFCGSDDNSRLEYYGDPLACIGLATLLSSKITGDIRCREL